MNRVQGDIAGRCPSATRKSQRGLPMRRAGNGAEFDRAEEDSSFPVVEDHSPGYGSDRECPWPVEPFHRTMHGRWEE